MREGGRGRGREGGNERAGKREGGRDINLLPLYMY